MSDAQIPGGVSGAGSSAATTQSAEAPVRIVSLPEAISERVRNVAEAREARANIRVQGEVTQVRGDNVVEVRTDRGERVEVQLRDNQTAPREGRRVEINIPPARGNDAQPQNATLRALPQDAPAQRSTATPVNVQVTGETPQTQTPRPQSLPQSLPPQTTPAALPPEGSTVRLQAILTQSANALPPAPTPQQLISSTVQAIEFQAQTITSQAINQAQAAILSVQTPNVQNGAQLAQAQAVFATPQTPVSFPAANTASVSAASTLVNATNALPAVTQTQFQPLTPTALQNIADIPVTFSQPPITAIFFGRTPSIAPAVFNSPPDVFAPLQGQPTQGIATSLQTPAALNAPRIQTLDVQINAIQPPALTIQAPASAAVSPATPQGYTPNPIFNASASVTTSPQTAPLPPANITLNNAPAPSVTGIVTNITADSLPVLTVFFPQGAGTGANAGGYERLFALQFPSDSVTIGTRLQVTPVGQNASAATSVLQGVPLPVFLSPATQWPAIDEALQTLTRTAPQVAQAFSAMIPSPASPANLAPALMFFVAAVRGGDLSQWLGSKGSEALKAAARGGKAISGLMSEGQALARAETLAQDWRTLNVPLSWNGELHKVGLYYKHEHDGAGDSDDRRIKSTRFVFDLALDRMGHVQLDGLFRPASEAGTRLDLVVRTEEVFAESTRVEMRRVYADALRNSNVTGELSFQSQPDAWVTIQAQDQTAVSVNT